MSCELCTDPDGVPCFPMYGLGPHVHKPGPMRGSTVLIEQVADGFTPEPNDPGMGVWWCPHCGDGKPVASTIDEGDAR